MQNQYKFVPPFVLYDSPHSSYIRTGYKQPHNQCFIVSIPTMQG